MSTTADKAWERFKTNMGAAWPKWAASAEAPPESEGPVSSLGVVGGSLPAVDAEALSQEWLALSLKSAARAREDEKLGRETGAWCNQARSEAYLLCADMLRQRAGLPTSRQPEENDQAQRRPVSASLSGKQLTNEPKR